MPILFNSLWPSLAAWVVLYISDYTLTIVCARLYRNGVNEKLAIEGSYELTPFFQRDIDALRKISPRFLAMLLISTGLLTSVWWTSHDSTPQLFVFASGAMIMLELTVHIRHFRNLFTFRAFNDPTCVSGRLEYSRLFVLRLSANELFSFSAMYLVLSAFTQSWFVLGGAVMCFSTAMKHRKLARKCSPKIPAATQPDPFPTNN